MSVLWCPFDLINYFVALRMRLKGGSGWHHNVSRYLREAIFMLYYRCRINKYVRRQLSTLYSYGKKQTQKTKERHCMLIALKSETGSPCRILLLHLFSPLRCRPRMAAAAAGINKQGAVATMEPCIRHGRGANGGTVKVVILSLKSTARSPSQ